MEARRAMVRPVAGLALEHRHLGAAAVGGVPAARMERAARSLGELRRHVAGDEGAGADPAVKKNRVMLRGDVPSPANPPSGCVFHPRCQHPAKDAACAVLVPPLEEKAPGHWVACIKQPPTGVDWSIQKAAGGTNPPARYLPVITPNGTPNGV